jgi:hypothetical protein
MTPGVEKAIEQLRQAFPESELSIEPDSNGGAYVFVTSVDIGAKFTPPKTWMGAHLPPQLPYADVYPLFMGGDVVRADGRPFVAPISPVPFQGRPALQISRRSNRHDPQLQSAATKFLKVLHWLEAEA